MHRLPKNLHWPKICIDLQKLHQIETCIDHQKTCIDQKDASTSKNLHWPKICINLQKPVSTQNMHRASKNRHRPPKTCIDPKHASTPKNLHRPQACTNSHLKPASTSTSCWPHLCIDLLPASTFVEIPHQPQPHVNLIFAPTLTNPSINLAPTQLLPLVLLCTNFKLHQPFFLSCIDFALSNPWPLQIDPNKLWIQPIKKE